MNIEQLKSGKYRITQMHKGKRFRITIDYKPSKYEAQKLITDEINKDAPLGSGKTPTFYEAVKLLVSSKSNILSIKTSHEYLRLNEQLNAEYPEFANTRILNITNHQIQCLINDYAQKRKGKSVKNLYYFIKPVINKYRKGFIFDISLPPVIQEDIFIPEDYEVSIIANAIKGSPFEIAIMLGACGLRRSEICALEKSDFDFMTNKVHVNKAKLLGPDNKWHIVMRNKTEKSTRDVYLPPYIMQIVQQADTIYDGHPNSITKHLKKIEKQCGLENFSLHKLRHYYVAMSSTNGAPEEYIMEQGGWSDPYVMKKVYRSVQKSKRSQVLQKSLNHLNCIFEDTK